MAYPSKTGKYILDCDACGYSIGSILSQIQDFNERVIAYRTETLGKSERSYYVTDRDLLAVKFSVTIITPMKGRSLFGLIIRH